MRYSVPIADCPAMSFVFVCWLYKNQTYKSDQLLCQMMCNAEYKEYQRENRLNAVCYDETHCVVNVWCSGRWWPSWETQLTSSHGGTSSLHCTFYKSNATCVENHSKIMMWASTWRVYKPLKHEHFGLECGPQGPQRPCSGVRLWEVPLYCQ